MRVKGKSGRQLAADYAQRLEAFLRGSRRRPLPRFNGALNRSAIAAACGLDRKVFQTNPRCVRLLEQADRDDQQRFPDTMARAEALRERRAVEDGARYDLEAKLLRLAAENASLRAELARLRQLERLMLNEGRLP